MQVGAGPGEPGVRVHLAIDANGWFELPCPGASYQEVPLDALVLIDERLHQALERRDVALVDRHNFVVIRHGDIVMVLRARSKVPVPVPSTRLVETVPEQ
jgi:hypothetical protein